MKNRDLEVSKPVRVAFVVELMRLDVQTEKPITEVAGAMSAHWQTCQDL